MGGRTPRDLLTPAALHILMALATRPLHGLGIKDHVEERTEGTLRLGPSSLYYSLGRLEDAGLIEETVVDGEAPHEERRRYYRLTGTGRERLREEARLLEDMVSHARAHGYLR